MKAKWTKTITVADTSNKHRVPIIMNVFRCSNGKIPAIDKITLYQGAKNE